jgi:hypothetical protein
MHDDELQQSFFELSCMLNRFIPMDANRFTELATSTGSIPRYFTTRAFASIIVKPILQHNGKIRRTRTSRNGDGNSTSVGFSVSDAQPTAQLFTRSTPRSETGTSDPDTRDAFQSPSEDLQDNVTPIAIGTDDVEKVDLQRASLPSNNGDDDVSTHLGSVSVESVRATVPIPAVRGGFTLEPPRLPEHIRAPKRYESLDSVVDTSWEHEAFTNAFVGNELASLDISAYLDISTERRESLSRRYKEDVLPEYKLSAKYDPSTHDLASKCVNYVWNDFRHSCQQLPDGEDRALKSLLYIGYAQTHTGNSVPKELRDQLCGSWSSTGITDVYTGNATLITESYAALLLQEIFNMYTVRINGVEYPTFPVVQKGSNVYVQTDKPLSTQLPNYFYILLEFLLQDLLGLNPDTFFSYCKMHIANNTMSNPRIHRALLDQQKVWNLVVALEADQRIKDGIRPIIARNTGKGREIEYSLSGVMEVTEQSREYTSFGTFKGALTEEQQEFANRPDIKPFYDLLIKWIHSMEQFNPSSIKFIQAAYSKNCTIFHRLAEVHIIPSLSSQMTTFPDIGFTTNPKFLGFVHNSRMKFSELRIRGKKVVAGYLTDLSACPNIPLKYFQQAVKRHARNVPSDLYSDGFDLVNALLNLSNARGGGIKQWINQASALFNDLSYHRGDLEPKPGETKYGTTSVKPNSKMAGLLLLDMEKVLDKLEVFVEQQIQTAVVPRFQVGRDARFVFVMNLIVQVIYTPLYLSMKSMVDPMPSAATSVDQKKFTYTQEKFFTQGQPSAWVTSASDIKKCDASISGALESVLLQGINAGMSDISDEVCKVLRWGKRSVLGPDGAMYTVSAWVQTLIQCMKMFEDGLSVVLEVDVFFTTVVKRLFTFASGVVQTSVHHTLMQQGLYEGMKDASKEEFFDEAWLKAGIQYVPEDLKNFIMGLNEREFNYALMYSMKMLGTVSTKYDCTFLGDDGLIRLNTHAFGNTFTDLCRNKALICNMYRAVSLLWYRSFGFVMEIEMSDATSEFLKILCMNGCIVAQYARHPVYLHEKPTSIAERLGWVDIGKWHSDISVKFLDRAIPEMITTMAWANAIAYGNFTTATKTTEGTVFKRHTLPPAYYSLVLGIPVHYAGVVCGSLLANPGMIMLFVVYDTLMRVVLKKAYEPIKETLSRLDIDKIKDLENYYLDHRDVVSVVVWNVANKKVIDFMKAEKWFSSYKLYDKGPPKFKITKDDVYYKDLEVYRHNLLYATGVSTRLYRSMAEFRAKTGIVPPSIIDEVQTRLDVQVEQKQLDDNAYNAYKDEIVEYLAKLDEEPPGLFTALTRCRFRLGLPLPFVNYGITGDAWCETRSYDVHRMTQLGPATVPIGGAPDDEFFKELTGGVFASAWKTIAALLMLDADHSLLKLLIMGYGKSEGEAVKLAQRLISRKTKIINLLLFENYGPRYAPKHETIDYKLMREHVTVIHDSYGMIGYVGAIPPLMQRTVSTAVNVLIKAIFGDFFISSGAYLCDTYVDARPLQRYLFNALKGVVTAFSPTKRIQLYSKFDTDDSDLPQYLEEEGITKRRDRLTQNKNRYTLESVIRKFRLD